MNAKMVAANAAWCRHYGKRGRDGDQERRSIKRGKKGDWRKDLRKDRL